LGGDKMETQVLISESYEEKYERSKHAVGISMWHFEWCTKYRYRMFRKEEQRNLITACIRRTAWLHKIKILELNVQPEHVHCVVGIKLNMSPAHALQMLKGVSARLFFKMNPKARLRYPKGHL
jgi:putative transposase